MSSFYGLYRVSHIKLDRVNGSKLRFMGQIRKFKKNKSFKKYLIKAIIENFVTKILDVLSILCVLGRYRLEKI